MSKLCETCPAFQACRDLTDQYFIETSQRFNPLMQPSEALPIDPQNLVSGRDLVNNSNAEPIPTADSGTDAVELTAPEPEVLTTVLGAFTVHRASCKGPKVKIRWRLLEALLSREPRTNSKTACQEPTVRKAYRKVQKTSYYIVNQRWLSIR